MAASTSRRQWGLRAFAAVAACLGAPLRAASAHAPVVPALERPALRVRRPDQAIVLGAAHAGERLVVVGERGIIIVSDDGGGRWSQVPAPVSVTLTAVRFVDATHGFAVGHGGVVLATADGGASWTKRLDGLQAARLVLAVARMGGDEHALRQAERLVADGPDKPFFDLHFHDRDHGLVIGACNLAFSTSDGGLHWQCVMPRIDNPGALHLYALHARGDVLLIAGEQGLAYRSDDRGRTFTRLSVPYKGSFFTAALTSDDGRGMLLAGLMGTVWQSADGGANWAAAPSQAHAAITGSAPIGAGPSARVVLVNQAGQLLVAHHGAVELLVGAALPPLTGVLPLAPGRVLALGIAGPVVRAVPEL